MRTPARTWEGDGTPLNLLVSGVVLQGDTVPLVWAALDHDGNSGPVRLRAAGPCPAVESARFPELIGVLSTPFHPPGAAGRQEVRYRAGVTLRLFPFPSFFP